MSWQAIEMPWPAFAAAVSAGTVVMSTAALIAAVATCFRLARRPRAESFKRGALLGEGRRAQRRLSRERRGGDPSLSLAGVAISRQDETKHFKLIGATGTGKSSAIRGLMVDALARGDRAVFADPDGGYLARFFDAYRGDVVLNPFEQGSRRWDPFAEISDAYDVDQLASALIPASEDPSAREWRGYARTFLAAVIRRRYESGARDLGELWHLLMVASVEELRPLVAGTPAQPFL
jgi:type IV secretory pathway TraG/TraD family ATPase VirD4